jgi:predicted RND superfamily exporter protein
MKNWFINQSLNHPKRTIILCLVFTAFMASGLRFFYIEDDMMKILPKNMPTVKPGMRLKRNSATQNLYISPLAVRVNRYLKSQQWQPCGT